MKSKVFCIDYVPCDDVLCLSNGKGAAVLVLYTPSDEIPYTVVGFSRETGAQRGVAKTEAEARDLAAYFQPVLFRPALAA